MAENDDTPATGETEQSDDDTPIPAMQRIMDSPFLLLFLGVTIPTVFYLLWGLIEIAQVPIAP